MSKKAQKEFYRVVEPLMVWPLQVCSAGWAGTHGPGYNVQRGAKKLMCLREALVTLQG